MVDQGDNDIEGSDQRIIEVIYYVMWTDLRKGKAVRGTMDWKKWGIEGQERPSEIEDQGIAER